jgi:exodeoxyribonuclease VII small subunit
MTEPRPVQELTFEEAFAELEGLVAKLESGDLPLEEALALFERGQALAEHCHQLLQDAELKLRRLQQDEGSEFTMEDFQE